MSLNSRDRRLEHRRTEPRCSWQTLAPLRVTIWRKLVAELETGFTGVVPLGVLFRTG